MQQLRCDRDSLPFPGHMISGEQSRNTDLALRELSAVGAAGPAGKSGLCAASVRLVSADSRRVLRPGCAAACVV